MYTPIRLIKINQHNYDKSVYIVNLYSESTDSPVIMFYLHIYSLDLSWEFPIVK